MAPGDSVISLVDADPDLADLLDEASLERARRDGLARVKRLSPGLWDAEAAYEQAEHHRGFLIVEGLLTRTVNVLGRHCVELIGHGDVMRPWQWDEAGSHVRAEIGWQVLEPTRLAVLDHKLVLRIAPWPQLGLELFNRGTRRAHHLAVALAIAHHQRVGDRLRAHALASGRALGTGPPRRDRRPASARPPAPRRPRRRAAPVRDHGDGAAHPRGVGQPARRRRLGAPRRAAGGAAPPPPRGRADLIGDPRAVFDRRRTRNTHSPRDVALQRPARHVRARTSHARHGRLARRSDRPTFAPHSLQGGRACCGLSLAFRPSGPTGPSLPPRVEHSWPHSTHGAPSGCSTARSTPPNPPLRFAR